MSINEIYKEGNTHAVIKKSDAPISTKDIRPSMYELLKVPLTINSECAEYIDNDMAELVQFVAGRENGKTELAKRMTGIENGKRTQI